MSISVTSKSTLNYISVSTLSTKLVMKLWVTQHYLAGTGMRAQYATDQKRQDEAWGTQTIR